jgi:endonuclease VIII
MPEGDTIFRTARTLQRALAGRVVTRFESAFPALNRVAVDRPIVGRSIESVRSRGKHLLMTLTGDLILHTHMRMNGSWHIYRPGERWQRSRHDMRILIATEAFVAVGFNVPVAEWLSTRDLVRHRELQSLGPDPLDPAFDGADVLARLRALGSVAVADALLNQRVVAGIGNVLKSEILFVAGIDPFAPVASIDDALAGRLIDVARELLASNVLGPAQSLSASLGRRTTRSMNPAAKLWVYGRGGKPCRRCGAVIHAKKTGVDARITYWCPTCQRVPTTSESEDVRI